MARAATWQIVGQKKLDRSKHVWKRYCGDDPEFSQWWKCVLCGGLSRQPDDTTPCNRFELPLTGEEKSECPNPKTPTVMRA